MLHKSFKPAKCKTALKMASSRIKLLKNKREAHVKQLKRELAQLLEAGQDQTARIRVEHVVREEKTLAAYDLIDIYCELIVARLQIIESQKACPIDLKEAVTSIIFASPRCADIPELMDARKHFTAKYGKDFVTSAVELRPDCGVSRLLVEKLSTKAPDGPTKIKILSAIADEHNIKWEPKSFDEKDSKPPEDLLSGPTTFEQASKMSSPHPTAQEPSNSFVKRPPNVQFPANHYEKPDPTPGPSSHPQNFPSKVIGGNEATPTDTFHPSPRHSGTGAGVEYRDSSPGDSRWSWNMEFKDATAAAQAAAESAERASLAARAAAELSSRGRMSRQHSAESRKSSTYGERMSRQHSTESRKSSAPGSRDEFQNNTGSKFQDENLSRGPVNSKYRSHGMHHEEVDNSEQDVEAGLSERFNNLKSSAKPTSNLGSTKSTMDDYRPYDNIPMSDKQSQRSSFELEKRSFRYEYSVRGDSSESEVEPESGLYDGMKSVTTDHFEEAYFKKQSSSVSSHPYSQTFSEDHHVVSNSHNPELGKTATGDHFVVDDANHQRNSMEANLYDNLYDNSDVVFDDYGSDHDDLKFDADEKSYGRESSSYFPAEGRQSSHTFADTNAWSYHTNISEGSKSSHSLNEPARKPRSQSIFAPEQPSTSLFSEDLRGDAVSSRQDDLKSVAYDDSDAASSDSGEEVDNSKDVRTANAGSSSRNESLNSRKFQSTHAESDNEEAEVGAETEWEPGYRDLHTRKPSARLEKSQSNSNGSIKRSGPSSANYHANESLHNEEAKSTGLSSLEGSKGLNFGALTGGLRHKGYMYPPYRRNPSSDSLSSKQSSDDTHTQDEQSSSNCKVEVSMGAQSHKPYDQTVHPRHKETGSRTTVMSSDSSDDGSDEKSSRQNASSGRDLYDQRAYTDTNDKSRPKMYYSSDNSDSKEDFPKQTSAGTSRFGSAFSRRTKASASDPVRNASPKDTVLSESIEIPDHVMERKSFSRRSGDTETPQKPKSQTESSGYWKAEAEGAAPPSVPIPQLNRSSQKETPSHSSYGTDTQPSDLYQSRRSDFWGGYEPQRSAERAATKSKRSSRDENLKSSPPPEQPSKPPSKTVTSDGAESSKASSSNTDPPSRENSITRASHVHPKLPDYDTFAAHLLFLKQNRQ